MTVLTPPRYESRLKTLCSQRGITIYRLARELDVAQSTLNDIANGISYPALETTKKLCTYFGVTSDILFTVRPSS